MSQPELTVAYITSRKEPKSEWFFASLSRELESWPGSINLVMVDAFHNKERFDQFDHDTRLPAIKAFTHVPPKPNPWQGEHRLTKTDWFAAANARNTALCLAPDGYLAYVDDLSVLLPGWLSCVKEAIQGGYIACGAYRKVKKLSVDPTGLVTNYVEFPGGNDNRLAHVTAELTPCQGNWLYGCSCAMPVEALLQINGWPEDLCDGQGFEDCCCGIVLQNAGYKFFYDRRMMTFESEEHHHSSEVMRREDYGESPKDKSHRALEIAQASQRFPNSYNIRELRERVLSGHPFPIRQTPAHEWFTGKHLSEL
jgi:hypothetical protein